MWNKAEHAVQSYAAGIGGRGTGGLVPVGAGGLGSIYQRISDPKQCLCRTILPVGLKDGRRRRRRRRRRRKKRKMAVPRAAAAYGRQLKKTIG